MKSHERPKLIVVAGPTASGKSDLAIALARRFGGEIISADSRQVYRGMDIGTGKVSAREQKLVRHHLLDIASPKRQYSVAQWKQAAQHAIKGITARGHMPIICGGTGFWIDALIYDAHLPDVKPNPALRKALELQQTTELYAQLFRHDPVRAKTIDQHNRRRLIRALEIILTTGQPVPKVFFKSPYEVLYLAISPARDELIERIIRRLDARLKKGMVSEARRLHAQGISWRRMEELGLEYRWLALYLQDQISKTQMRDGMARDIARYAKRQLTWLRRNPDVVWVTGPAQAQRLAKKFIIL